MWRGLRSLWSWLGSAWVSARLQLTTSALRESPQISELPMPSNSQRAKSLMSAASWLRQVREINNGRKLGRRLRVLPLSLTALCLLSLPGCSLLSSKPPSAPAVVKCPVVQCLDRALTLCEGLRNPPPKTCADAVLVASDALGEIVVCQEAHAALIRCVEQFNAEAR